MSAIDPDKCPRCGTPLPLDLPRVCTRCALAEVQALATEESEPQVTEQTSHDVGDYKPGELIGQYKLVKRIGEGGFGVVYLAEDQNLDSRQVALKVIKFGMDATQAISRFKDERKALVKLEHSSIARVYCAEIPDTGLPYIVMELVRGKRITQYCDSHRLTLPQRLALFAKVCDAVHHAHLNGIIHCDITPSNILVVEESEEPLPKLIDFGIAKPMDEETEGGSDHLTTAAQRIGTPNYRSPEQAGCGDLAVDRRTDIYSLGVLLYELLVGCLPFSKKQLSLNSVVDTITTRTLLSPSAKLKRLGERELLNIAQKRSCRPSSLRRIDYKLDSIVMKCLRANREERYETAEALAADLQAYLRPNRHRVITYGIAAIILLVAVVWYLLPPRGGSRPQALFGSDLGTAHNVMERVIEVLESK
jgi:eukaryotic-like serine/threonine-protein kinase